MGAIDHDLGICSTFFVRTHSEYYNVLQSDEIAVIKNLANMGHEIGLHYEPAFYSENKIDIVKGIAMDCNVLVNIIGKSIFSISAHQPLLSDFDFDELRQNWFDMYADPKLKEVKYYSDSGMSFREKTLQEVCEDQTGPCQFLIHPDYWNETHTEWVLNLDNLVNQRIKQLESFANKEKVKFTSYFLNRDKHDIDFRKRLDAVSQKDLKK